MASMYSGLLAAKSNRRLQDRQDRADAQSQEIAGAQLKSEAITQESGLLGLVAKRAELSEMERRAVERQKSEGFAELLADVDTYGAPHPETLKKFNATGKVRLKTARKNENGDIELEDELGRKGLIPADRVKAYQPYYKENQVDDQKRDIAERSNSLAEQRNLLDMRKEIATDLDVALKNPVKKRMFGGPSDEEVAKYEADVDAMKAKLQKVQDALDASFNGSGKPRKPRVDGAGMPTGGLVPIDDRDPLGVLKADK
jgi:hypothetical protein